MKWASGTSYNTVLQAERAKSNIKLLCSTSHLASNKTNKRILFRKPQLLQLIPETQSQMFISQGKSIACEN